MNPRSLLRRPLAAARFTLLVLSLAGLATPQVVRAEGYSVRDGTLWLNQRPVLMGMGEAIAAIPDPSGTGVFLKLSILPPKPFVEPAYGALSADQSAFFPTQLGAIDGMKRFTSCYRYAPHWMRPAAGSAAAEVPAETQMLLVETERDDYLLLVPLIDGTSRFSLGGSRDGLLLYSATGDPAIPSTGGVALFVAVGTDPYRLVHEGARAVMRRLGTGKLRTEKPVPKFIDDFGWCTWNAFYRDVSQEKVKAGLQSFAAGGVEPRFMILDDGWQDAKTFPTGESRMESLNANEHFGRDLGPTVRMTKTEFKIRTFLVWHAIFGYWGGLDPKAFPEYHIVDLSPGFDPGLLQSMPQSNIRHGPIIGLVAPDSIHRFFDDFHRRLAEQGVDGVKVDDQSALEGVARGQGGRVALIAAYRQALESSVNAHFQGRLINCMSNGMETYYDSSASTLLRTSGDFRPQQPESHGAHLYCNAQVGLWFGEFMQPDWDMFQSGHPMGSFHAAGRAVSGGPVYVADEPGSHDFPLLRQLVLSDGSVLRADHVGRPTRDCLFSDCTREPVLLKIFNYNGDCGVLGVFNANFHAAKEQQTTISGSVSAADLPDLAAGEFVAFAHQQNRIWRCQRSDRTPLRLTEGTWEIVSFAPVDRGIAILGLADKLNSTGAIGVKGWKGPNSYSFELKDGGQLVAWAAKSPRSAKIDGGPVEFTHDRSSGRLTIAIPTGASHVVAFDF